jgi:PPK2 family polyphosphate:nucleotide phosphotransferase
MKKYRVKPGAKIKLADYDPDDQSEFDGDKRKASEKVDELTDALDSFQERLYAEGKRSVLFVIQAPDTGGKDGTIRRVFGNLNPQGCRVASFKAPSALELAHDFLWRIHQALPRRGEIGIFNRSHYEDVLIVRVHNLAPQEVWEKRYDHINAFEKMLTDEGTTIMKFYLHVSKEEQKERLQERLDDPDKHWKFNPGDLKERALWGDYTKAYEDMLNLTSTEWAPWYVVPANRKWYRNLVIARIAHDTLQELNPKYPETHEDFSGIVIE